MADQDEGDLHFKLAQVLNNHWLHDLGCSHEGEGSNQALCGCGWLGDRLPNVGAAKAQWVNHALEEMRPSLIEFGNAEAGRETSAEVASIAADLANITAIEIANLSMDAAEALVHRIRPVAASALGQRQ